MKKFVVIMLIVVLCLSAAACTETKEEAAKLTVVSEGSTEYSLTYPAKFSATRVELCNQFAQQLQKLTGASFTVQTDRDDAQAPQIIITEEALEAGDRRFVIRVDGENIHITGTGVYQTYLAMEYLLENYLSADGALTVPVDLDYTSPENQNLSGQDLQGLLESGRGAQFAPVKAKCLLSGITKYSTVQAVCTDGTYLYVAYCRNVREERTTPETAIVQKLDMEGNVLATSELLELNHANGISYDPTRQLLLVSCAKGVGNWYEGKRLAYVDPETLELVEYKESDVYLRTVEYVPQLSCYVGAGDDNFYLLDENFQTISAFTDQDPQYSKQSLCCDGQYIYDVRFQERAATEEPMVIHSLDGTYMGTVPIVEMADNEPESMFILDGDFYLGCHLVRMLYRMELLPQIWWP